MTIVIHSSHKIQYSQNHISFPLCHCPRHPPFSQTNSLTPFCAPNQPSYHSIPLNQIFNHSLDHQVIDSSQPALQPVSQSCTLMLSPKRAFIHRRSLSCFSSAISYPTLQSVNLSLFHALTYTCSHSTICSVSLNFLTTKPGVLSVFHFFAHTVNCSVIQSFTLPPTHQVFCQSLFRPHSQLLYQPFTLSPTHQVLCQSLFHPFVHTASCSISPSLFHPLTRCSVSHSFTLSPTPSCSVTQSFTLSHIHQVFYQSIFHSLAHTTSCSVSFSLFHTFGIFSRTRPFNRSPSQPSNHYLRYCDYGNNRHRSTDSGCRPPVRHRPQQVLE